MNMQTHVDVCDCLCEDKEAADRKSTATTISLPHCHLTHTLSHPSTPTHKPTCVFQCQGLALTLPTGCTAPQTLPSGSGQPETDTLFVVVQQKRREG